MKVLLNWKTQSVVQHQNAESILNNSDVTVSSLLSLLYETADQLGGVRVGSHQLVVVLSQLLIDLPFLENGLPPDYNRLKDLSPVLCEREDIFEPLPLELVEGFLTILFNLSIPILT